MHKTTIPWSQKWKNHSLNFQRSTTLVASPTSSITDDEYELLDLAGNIQEEENITAMENDTGEMKTLQTGMIWMSGSMKWTTSLLLRKKTWRKA